jgi:NADPH:quinone reductase
MRAAWYETNGSSAVLQTGEMAIPAVGADDVLVWVHASGINPVDVKGRWGWGVVLGTMPYPRIVPHNDGAGVIEQVGANVATSRLGERVWLYEAQWHRPFGTAADYVALPSALAVPLPATVSFAQGAFAWVSRP